MSTPAARFRCTCWRFCKGGKDVSRRTLRSHMQKADTPILASLTEPFQKRRRQESAQTANRGRRSLTRIENTGTQRQADMDNGGRPDDTTDGASNPNEQSEEDPHDNETNEHLDNDTDGAGCDGGQPEDRDHGGAGGVPGGDIGGNSNGAEDGEGDRSAGGPPEDRDSEELLLQETSSIADIDTTLRFIESLRSATLEESSMDPDDIEMLRKPAEYPLQMWTMQDTSPSSAIDFRLTTTCVRSKNGPSDIDSIVIEL